MTKILVVDDDESIREMLCMMFECSEYDVLHATNGVEALELLRTSPTQLVVLLDLFMPKLDGRGVLHIVAADSHLSTFHNYILLSADPDLHSFTTETTPAFSVPVLAKPFDLDDLLKVVDQAAQRVATPSYV
ncbi:MAG: hypothetical protein NVS4B11_08280 [Ktedonobacteraceae bacterium]